MKRIHQISGITIAIFVAIHLFNHVYSLLGITAHIEMMNDLRVFYRNVIAETVLLFAVLVQMISGIRLFAKKRKTVTGLLGKIQLWSGLYLVFFLIIHLSAVMTGRFIMNLDTNFYFGVAGLNTFPLNLFFIPYYFLAITSFFGHIAGVHSQKMKKEFVGIQPANQSYAILVFGIVLALITLFGLTNKCNGVEIPKEYNVLIGK